MFQHEQSNEGLVRAFYDLAFNGRRPDEAAAMYLGEAYRQHNDTDADGVRTFMGTITGFVQAFPDLRAECTRLLADGEFVVAEMSVVPRPGVPGFATMDIFRVRAGKIVEHWT